MSLRDVARRLRDWVSPKATDYAALKHRFDHSTTPEDITDLRLIAQDLERLTWNHYDRRTGSKTLLRTHSPHIDALVVTLNGIPKALRQKYPLALETGYLQTVTARRLDQYLNTQDGYPIPIQVAVERYLISLHSALDAFDQLIAQNDSMCPHYLSHSLPLRKDCAKLMQALWQVCDQTPTQP